MANNSLKPFVVVVVSAGLGIGAWLLLPLIAEKPSGNNTPNEVVDEDENVIARFDSNGDGIVERDEFEQLYGKTEVMTAPNGKNLTASQAFRIYDLNRDGVLDSQDEKLKGVVTWARFQQAANKDGFHPRKFGNKFYRLNDAQLVWFLEIGTSLVQNTLPWQGKLIGSKYFENWSQVVDNNGKAVLGFYTIVDDDKARLLKESGSIRVYDRADIVISKVADAPQNEYAQRLKKLQVNDIEGNLQLATDCAKWGFDKTATQLYQRVLVFDFKNESALKALNIVIEDNQYKEVN